MKIIGEGCSMLVSIDTLAYAVQKWLWEGMKTLGDCENVRVDRVEWDHVSGCLKVHLTGKQGNPYTVKKTLP